MLSIIIINYKNEKKTISFVQNELSKISLPHIIIIVNNEATTESDEILVKELQAVLISEISKTPISALIFVISQSENLGFAKGNNLGVEFVTKHFEITHFLFTNNDILFISENVVESLFNKLGCLDDNIALIGPKVIGLDGENQSPESYIPFWNRYIWMYWMTPFLSSSKKKKLFKLDDTQTAKEGVYYKVMGSFFIVKRADFVKCGMMDPNTFLFGEEIILSERLKAIGKKIYFFPEVTVLHEHGHTTSNYLSAKNKILTQFSSECYYYTVYRKVSHFSILIGKLSLRCYLKLKKI